MIEANLLVIYIYFFLQFHFEEKYDIYCTVYGTTNQKNTQPYLKKYLKYHKMI